TAAAAGPIADPAAVMTAPAATFEVNGLLNSGFEWIADSTTDPPKYGAYWFGAFEPVEGSPVCSITEDGAYRGRWCLRLMHVLGEVRQKIATDPRGTEELVLSLAIRTRRDGELLLTLEDGPGRRSALRVAAPESGSLADVRVTDTQGRPVAPLEVQDGGNGWWRIAIGLGARFRDEHGTAPIPRLYLRLAPFGPGGTLVDVDEVVARVRWPAVSPGELRGTIEAQVRETLQTWFLSEAEGGRGLIDPQTGYVAFAGCDVETGERLAPERSLGFHTIHKLLAKWLREARRLGRQDEVARWQPWLARVTRSLLANNFDPKTNLPRTVAAGTLAPENEKAITIHAYVGALLDARELLDDEELQQACLARARAVADRLLALQREHDLPDDRAPPLPVWNDKLGRFEGNVSNWHGFLPDRLTPEGGIETDRLYYTSWAILTGRTFWYELLRSPAAIARVHAAAPRPGDLETVEAIAARFHRDWDASRYDLENDTDDHYGYLAEDGLEIVELAGAAVPTVLTLVQRATDHRLERGAAAIDDTLWIQAVRLGTACAGDSPRAFGGPLGLYRLPPEINPATAGLPLYREALLELAANDFKGRQLTNGQFTESFFKDWEMVCICYKGKLQGDCREHPPEYWDGDVGDTFGGPAYSAIDAQTDAWRVAGPAERPLVLARLAILRDVTDATMRRRWGYLFGLDPAIARQYALLEKYVIGLSTRSAAGVGYAMAWLRLLPDLPDEPLPAAPRAELAEGGDELLVTAPPGSLVALPVQEQAFAAPVSDRDPRMLALDLALLPGGLDGAPRVTVGAEGEARVPLDRLSGRSGLLQPLRLDPASGALLAIGEPLRLP
ncbi:MAG TPA: hypothetical protein VFD43_03325, partial [Planctomycetota bacterium]|nr:hypothetical protein [Planctomycetota bacterium]